MFFFQKKKMNISQSHIHNWFMLTEPPNKKAEASCSHDLLCKVMQSSCGFDWSSSPFCELLPVRACQSSLRGAEVDTMQQTGKFRYQKWSIFLDCILFNWFEIAKLALVSMFVHVFSLRHVLHLHSAFHFPSLCLMSRFLLGSLFCCMDSVLKSIITVSQDFLFAFWSFKQAKKKAWHQCYSSLVQP